MKFVPPSTKETAFNCPHCGALANQFWSTTNSKPMPKGEKPRIWTNKQAEEFDFSEIEANDERETMKKLLGQLASGAPFARKTDEYPRDHIHNVWFSKCFNCDQLSIWIYDKLVYPITGSAPAPNPDLSRDIRRDYDEASAILDISPRGAAALIRLTIQKLCKELGQPGRNINDDIGALVTAGLDPRVQRALDAVRVIGNEAVHPGQIDLRDDRATAETLFRLLNLVAEKMISEPKHVDEVYASLPEDKLAAIETRDGKK